MGIPHGDDVMLNYQTTGFHETAALRELFGLTAIPPFQKWLEDMGFVRDGSSPSWRGTAPCCWRRGRKASGMGERPTAGDQRAADCWGR